MRTKKNITDPEPEMKYDFHQEPLVLSKSVLDLLLKQQNSSDCIALYCFYYYTTKWQKTNQIRCTTEYTAKGLQWSKDKVRKIKNLLRDLLLIEDIITKKDNIITGHYIRINLIWSTPISHPPGFPDYGMPQTMENPEGNTYIKNNINAYKKINKKNIYFPIAKFLAKIIEDKKNIKHTTTQINNWSNDISKLVEKNGVSIERIKRALRWYKEHCKDIYVPVIESGSSLRNKFIKLEAAMERSFTPFEKKDKTNNIGFRDPERQYKDPDLYV